MECFGVMNPPIPLNDKVSPSGVGNSHSEVEGIRNPPYGNLVRDLVRKRNHKKEPSHGGCDGRL
jgi:hypothetical protein